MNEGLIRGKNRENFRGSEEGSGACGERKAVEASEDQTPKDDLPWLLPSPARPPSCGCFAAGRSSIPATILREGEVGVGPSGCPSGSFPVSRAWGPAQGWEVTLDLSTGLEGLSVLVINIS